MKSALIKSICSISFAACFLTSCDKYEDPTSPDLNLTNRYCNLPYAVNYNWNFPGIEDNSTCFFSWDFYEGKWQFINDVYNVNNNVDKLYSDTIILEFNKNTADTTQSNINVSGWCNNGLFSISVDKYYIAKTDTLTDGSNYQIVCNDSIKGSFEKNIMDSTQMSLKLLVNTPNGQFNFIGTGTKL